ncbi:uncharacterized protein P884DRAFT_261672, partial [Thermothelomyces heterothallicus CBS 202.75]|uniref:uncharacterized protein n=1 Tax=Thermothelomyces heterothallicus CBS 202.75 TaxID=1149848 RepID=UPI003743D8C7
MSLICTLGVSSLLYGSLWQVAVVVVIVVVVGRLSLWVLREMFDFLVGGLRVELMVWWSCLILHWALSFTPLPLPLTLLGIRS